MESNKSTGFKNVDDYIALQPEQIRLTLEILRQTIKKAAPEAEEVISYQMPGYKFYGVLVWFAAFKSHIGFYCIPSVLQKFKDQLSAYKLTKSAIRFPFGTPVPEKLITAIVREAITESHNRKTAKEALKCKSTIK